jgi:cryptochrome
MAGPNKAYGVPTMEEMGYEPSTTSIRGGTDEGHKRLAEFLGDTTFVATFSKPNTAPTSLEPSTTLLSPYLKFGCIGVRELWWGSKDAIKRWEKEGGKGKKTNEPENMFGQLEFRDMYAAAEAGTPHFQRIRGNHTCK